MLEKVIDDSSRAQDFYVRLRNVEYQTSRLVTNPNFNLRIETIRTLMQEKSTDLFTGIIQFFNSALLYFCPSFFGGPGADGI